MNRWALVAVAVCILTAGCGGDAQTAPSNQPLVFSAILSPANEVPPIGNAESGGRGAVQVQFDVTRGAGDAITAATASFYYQLSGFPARAAVHSMAPMSVTVLHLVSRFWVGGAERQFIERLRAHPPGFSPLVACLELSGGNLDEFLSLGLRRPEAFDLRGSLRKPNTLIQESVRAFYTGWYKELVTTMPTIKDGHVLPMEGPGLGTELLPSVFERSDLTVRRSEA